MEVNGCKSASNDEDDPVIKEVPIFISKNMDGRLYVFQYPLNPTTPEAEMHVKKCLVKPVNQEVMIEMELNVNSSNFDSSKAEDIAFEVDKSAETRKDNESMVFENGLMDKVILTSSKVVSDTNNYAIGTYNGRELHLTPLNGFLQMRPNFSYMDKSSKRKLETKADADDEEAGPSSAQQVTVKFSKGEAENRWKKSKENSYKKLLEKSAEEKWIRCSWYKEKSSQSELEKMKLYSDKVEDVTKQLKVTNASEYIHRLVPQNHELTSVAPSLPSNAVSLHALRVLPLLEQCRLLLKESKVISFQQLMMLLAGGEGITADTLLKTLPQVAVLVRGNWVVKSEVIYPKDTFSAITGVPSDVMCRARDYVLHLFTKNQFLERRKVSTIVKVPSEEIKEIFMGIARLRFSKGWELSLPADTNFINKHPEIVQRQNLIWEQKTKQLTECFKDPKEKRRRHKSKSMSEESSDGGKRNKKDGKDPCLSSDTDSGTERNKKSPAVIRKTKSNVKT